MQASDRMLRFWTLLILTAIPQLAAAQPPPADAGAFSPDAGVATPPPDGTLPDVTPPDALPPPPPEPRDRVALVDGAVYSLDPQVGQIVTQMFRRELESRGFDVLTREEVVAGAQAIAMPYPPPLHDLRRLGNHLRVRRVVFPRAWARGGQYVFDVVQIAADGTTGYAIGSPPVGQEPAAIAALVDEALAARRPPPAPTGPPTTHPPAPGPAPGADPWREQQPVEEPPDPEDLLWGVEGEAHLDMGMMWHSVDQMDELFFETLGPIPVGFVGAGGRIEAGSRNHGLARAVLAIETDLRISNVPATGSEPLGTFDEGGTRALFRIVPTIGYDSQTFEIAGGAYFGNGMIDTPAYLAAHARFGRYDKFHFRMSILDERGCYPASCLAALAFGFTISPAVRSKIGFSFGDEVFRTWAEVDFRALGRWWDILGDFALHDDAATLSLAIGTSWFRE